VEFHLAFKRSKRVKTDPYRSNFERTIAENLKVIRIPIEYETIKLAYITPAIPHKYTPDFILPNGIVIEAKGRLKAADRKKMILVREQNPTKDIRFVFQRAKNTISKSSKTTYAMWAEKNGFQWAQGTIPIDWINEKRK